MNGCSVRSFTNGHAVSSFTLSLVIALVLGLFGCSWTRADDAKTAKPRAPKITISKETTYVTGPLCEDGTIDYIAAINQSNSQGVTPDNNAAALAWHAIALFQEVLPENISEPARRRYFELVGVKKAPIESQRLLEYPEFLAESEGWERPSSAKAPAAVWDSEEKHFHEAVTEPWSRRDHVRVAELLERNQKALDLLAVAAERPQFYSPLVLDADWRFNDSSLVPMLVGRRLNYGCLELHARAMLRLKSGQIAEAWGDALACYRLTRLQTRGADIEDWMLASMGAPSVIPFVERANADSSQLKAWQADLARLPKADSLADCWNRATRLFLLGKLTDVARHGYRQTAGKKIEFNDMSGTEWLGASGDDDAHAKTIQLFTSVPRLDWDEALRHCNARLDAIVAACNRPTRSRRASLASYDAEVNKNAKRALELGSLGKPLSANMTSKEISQLFVDAFYDRGFQCAGELFDFEVERRLEAIGDDLALALAAYRYDHKRYPDALAELAPKYLPTVPTDPFSDGALHYQLAAGGYTLYSVGPNGKDDGGRNSWDERRAKSKSGGPSADESKDAETRDDISLGVSREKSDDRKEEAAKRSD